MKVKPQHKRVIDAMTNMGIFITTSENYELMKMAGIKSWSRFSSVLSEMKSVGVFTGEKVEISPDTRFGHEKSWRWKYSISVDKENQQ